MLKNCSPYGPKRRGCLDYEVVLAVPHAQARIPDALVGLCQSEDVAPTNKLQIPCVYRFRLAGRSHTISHG